MLEAYLTGNVRIDTIVPSSSFPFFGIGQKFCTQKYFSFPFSLENLTGSDEGLRIFTELEMEVR
jgi:hypothetical protein